MVVIKYKLMLPEMKSTLKIENTWKRFVNCRLGTGLLHSPLRQWLVYIRLDWGKCEVPTIRYNYRSTENGIREK